MSEPERKEIEKALQDAYDEMLKNQNQLPDRLYSALEGFSSVLLAWKESGGKPGWSQRLVGLDGKHLFTKEQGKQLEKAIHTIEPELDDFFSKETQQRGGAEDSEEASLDDLRPSSMFQKMKDQSSFETNVSLDSMYYGLQEKIKAYDEQWKEISDNLGIVKGIESRDVMGFIPLPTPIPYVIPGKAVLPIVSAMLDMLRILFTNVFDVATARIVLSLSLTFLDLLRGDWQNALLSLLGAVSKRGVLLGFFGKLVHNAWYLIAPDIRRQLSDSVYRSGKSVIVGFFLWGFTTFSPQFILQTVQRSLDQVRDVITDFNNKSAAAEDKVKSTAAQVGVDVEFPKVPLSMVPSLDDVQNLQVLARTPEIYCSKEVQDILRPLFLIPPLRLALELLNIPTVSSQIDAQCSDLEGKSLKDIAVNELTPKVSLTDLPVSLPEMPKLPDLPALPSPLKGGKRKTLKKRRKAKNNTRRT